MKDFNAKQMKDQVVEWIRDWFEENGKGCNAVLGVSGGKDSSIVAALCVEALGKDRVIGVTMPNGVQKDISDSMRLINHLSIRYCNVNIGDTCNTLMTTVKEQLGTLGKEVSEQTTINLPPRVRMTTLYAVSQSMNGRVANTCNLSEDWVGYSTRYGDAAGDFAPLGGEDSCRRSLRQERRGQPRLHLRSPRPLHPYRRMPRCKSKGYYR